MIFKFIYLIDQLTFKSKRYRDNPRIKLDFYINDLLEEQMSACCEHKLIHRYQNHIFRVETVIGSKPCLE